MPQLHGGQQRDKTESRPGDGLTWRWFWDYGTGGLGDFGCHYMDLPHWALELKHPTSIVATGPKVHPEAATAGVVVKYQYPSRGGLPSVDMTWHDGGKKPGSPPHFDRRRPMESPGS